MSSAAYLTYHEGEEITREQWERFAVKHDLHYDPHVVGQNTDRCAGLPISVRFGGDGYRPPNGDDGSIDFATCTPPSLAREITISTYFGDAAYSDVAALAVAAWQELGGSLEADPEIRRFIRV